jgi:hypothetical protein
VLRSSKWVRLALAQPAFAPCLAHLSLRAATGTHPSAHALAPVNQQRSANNKRVSHPGAEPQASDARAKSSNGAPQHRRASFAPKQHSFIFSAESVERIDMITNDYRCVRHFSVVQNDAHKQLRASMTIFEFGSTVCENYDGGRRVG